MKKCKGCGVVLQNTNSNEIGYVLNLEQDYCQRCFRLSHYGDLNNFNNQYVTNEKVINIYEKYSNELFVVIVDFFDIFSINSDTLFEIFNKYKVLLIINKTDLLPNNINDEKANYIFSKILFNLNKKYKNIVGCILTNKYENKFNENFFDFINKLNYRKIVFAGRANAGKSSLINKLLNNNDLTISMYPGTTLEEIEITYKEYIFIDTPGLVDNNNFVTHLNLEKYKLAKIDKTIKPQLFQFSEKQAYFYQGLFYVDVIPYQKASIVFYVNNNIEIHRTKYENAIAYYENNYHEFKLKVKPLVDHEYFIEDKTMFVLKGIGLIKVVGKCKINIHSLKDVNIYVSEVYL